MSHSICGPRGLVPGAAHSGNLAIKVITRYTVAAQWAIDDIQNPIGIEFIRQPERICMTNAASGWWVNISNSINRDTLLRKLKALRCSTVHVKRDPVYIACFI